MLYETGNWTFDEQKEDIRSSLGHIWFFGCSDRNDQGSNEPVLRWTLIDKLFSRPRARLLFSEYYQALL